MSDLLEKKRIILDHEARFAVILALKVIEKPKLNVWMILVPIIFVYYFYQLQRFSTGKKTFSEHYMIAINRAVNEAAAVIAEGKTPDPAALAGQSDVPELVRDRQSKVYHVLLEHYIDLLKAEGDDFDSLIRTAYGSRTNYLLYCNRINQVEKARNKALIPLMEQNTEGVDEIIEKLENHSETLRREMVDRIFSY
ncbi:MAG TPA: hypothetical protein HPQ03_14480 [Deltaproteobacteria bacterium]|nr:hypothetical protein [Deltaproteobacteria bacterium]